MLTIYKSNEQKQLLTLNALEKGAWVNIVNPNEKEINFLVQNLSIDEYDIRHILDLEETAHIEIEEDYTMIIVDVPIIEHEGKSEFFTTIPLGIIVTTSDH